MEDQGASAAAHGRPPSVGAWPGSKCPRYLLQSHMTITRKAGSREGLGDKGLHTEKTQL